MNTKKILLSVSALALVGVVGLGAASLAFAQGNPIQMGMHGTGEQHEAVQKALENKDYNAFKELTRGMGMMSRIVTEENFAKITEAHQLMEQGKYDEARAVRQELGLGMGMSHGMGYGRMAQ